MECTLGLFGPSSASGSVSLSPIHDSNTSKIDILDKDFVGNPPIQSSPSSALQLDLGLALHSAAPRPDPARIFTAQDFPIHSSNASVAVSGTKRPAHSALNQVVVGWPPIRTYRMNSLVNQAKKDNKTTCDVDGKEGNHHLGFVKVNVDGVVIGRKLDLTAHSSYHTLALMLEDMFFTSPFPNGHSGDKEQARKVSKLLDGSSEFVLTYEDREGDWMLVGDVPWGMFLSSVRRLRIMRTSEANGLAPRTQDKKLKQRSKPI